VGAFGQALRVSDAVGTFAMVFILPDDINITSGSPRHHRSFLDMYLCQFSRSYLMSLMEYQRILKQRNALLRVLKGARSSEGLKHLDSWDVSLITPMLDIIRQRAAFLAEIGPKVGEIAQELSKNRDLIEISYLPRLDVAVSNNPEMALAMLKKERVREIKMGSTLIGPHRDLFEITIGGVLLRNYGSMGQKKSVMIAMKLAALRSLTEHRGEQAILVMDEAFAALDKDRSRALLNLLSGIGQVFLASAGFREHTGDFKIKVYDIVDGIVRER
jgi:DNA replication and repair protein RecF